MAYYKPKITYGNSQDFEDILYGTPSREMSRYLSEKMNEAYTYITDRTKNFFAKSREVFENLSGETARKRITNRMLLNNVTLNSNSISKINDNNRDNICNINRRYLMANPELYNLKRKGRIEGFNGAYDDYDKYQTDVYWKRDYKRAKDGLVVIKKDSEYLEYLSTVEDSVDRLTFAEQITINQNWRYANRMLKEDIDITANVQNNTDRAN